MNEIINLTNGMKVRVCYLGGANLQKIQKVIEFAHEGYPTKWSELRDLIRSEAALLADNNKIINGTLKARLSYKGIHTLELNIIPHYLYKLESALFEGTFQDAGVKKIFCDNPGSEVYLTSFMSNGSTTEDVQNNDIEQDVNLEEFIIEYQTL